MQNLAENKEILRKRLLEKRRNIQNKDEKDNTIAKQFLLLDDYINAEVILLYVSTNEEVSTKRVIANAVEAGKKVFVPICIGQHRMEFYEFTSFSELTVSKFGILEPNPKGSEKLEIFGDVLCVVPAISFDAERYRLGYGGGYYDRFIESYDDKIKTIGLCYEEMLSEILPRENHDKRVDMIITDGKEFK